MKGASIKIGALLTFSGSEKMAGSMCLEGAKIAVAEINAIGGVLAG